MKELLPDTLPPATPPAALAVVVVVDVSKYDKTCIHFSAHETDVLENSPSSTYKVTITTKGIPAAIIPMSNPITRVIDMCCAHHPAFLLSIERYQWLIKITILRISYLVVSGVGFGVCIGSILCDWNMGCWYDCICRPLLNDWEIPGELYFEYGTT